MGCNNGLMKLGDQSRIAHILFNSLMHDDIIHASESTEYADKLRKITEIGLANSCKHSVIIHENFNNNISNYISNVHQLNFDIAVIWFEGSWPCADEFEDYLLAAVDGEWKQYDWLCAGHILDRQNNDGPHFHQQCIVINMDAWNQLPDNHKALVSRKWPHSSFPAYEMSDEHIHDDYTPVYLNPMPDLPRIQNIKLTNRKLDCLIPIALSNNMRVMNLNNDIRDTKHCCYPEDNIEETKHWFLNDDLNSMTGDHVIGDDKHELYGMKVMDTNVMYITNTEDVPSAAEYDCTVMTAPCSGLHQFKHMINARNTLTRVIWTDFSEAGIWWTKKVLAEWNGINFDEFYRTHEAELEEKWVAYNLNNYDLDLVYKFENSFNTQVEWLEHWDWIRSLNHTFMQVDLMKDWKIVCDEIGKNETVFMQISNIWHYEINYVNNGFYAPQAAYINLIKEVLENNKDLYITGDSPGGSYYNYKNIKQIVSCIF
jgi:hypothetical protein